MLVGAVLLISVFALMNPRTDNPGQEVALSSIPTAQKISNSSVDCDYPLVGVDANGAAYVIWIESISQNTNCPIKFTTNKSGSWSTPQTAAVIRYFGTDPPGHKDFSVSASGACQMVIRDPDAGFTHFTIYHSIYESNTWTTPVSITDQPGTATYIAGALNPVDNYYYALWQDDSVHMWDFWMRYRTPGGTLGPIGQVLSNTGYHPNLAIGGNGRAHLVWSRTPSGSAKYSRNDNPRNSSGWISPITIVDNSGIEWNNARLDCDNFGNAYIIWKGNLSGNDEIYFRKVASDGTLSSVTNVSNTPGNFSEDEVADISVNRQNGDIFIAWTESGDVYYNYCQQGSWIGSQKIPTGGASGPPGTAVDSGGSVHLTFAALSNGVRQIFYTTTSSGPNTTTSSGPSTSTSTSTTSTTTSTTTSIPVKPYPPLNPALNTQLNASQTQKVNTLSWQSNPANANLALKEYWIYRKRANMSDSDFSRIGVVPTGTFQYADTALPLAQRYTYGLTTLPMDPYGLESNGSAFVTELAAFQPLGVACKTVVNNSLFRSEKINVISWMRNPLNDAVTIAQYNIYRKKVGEDDSAYNLIKSSGAGVFEYQDRKLSFSDQYQYVITAVETGGFESARSSPAREGT
jgi:hypothetical protein